MVQDFETCYVVFKEQETSCNMLENLINDLLDLAKMENNKFSLNYNYFDLIETIEQTLKIFLF